MKKPKRTKTKSRPPDTEWTTTNLDGSPRKAPYPPDTSDLQRRIKENPIAVSAEARYKLGEVQAGYRRDLYDVLAMIVGIARHLFEDYKAWKPFFAQPFFQTGSRKLKARKQQHEALRHTMNYVFDAKSKQKRNRTGKYAAALHEIMIIGVPVHLVAQEIEAAGGIERLYEAYLEREAHRPKKGHRRIMNEADYFEVEKLSKMISEEDDNGRDMILDDLDDGLELDDEDDPNEALDIFADADVDAGPEPKVERGRDPAGRPTIEFEMIERIQARFLNLDRRRATVDIEGLGYDADGWQRLRVRKVTWKGR